MQVIMCDDVLCSQVVLCHFDSREDFSTLAKSYLETMQAKGLICFEPCLLALELAKPPASYRLCIKYLLLQWHTCNATCAKSHKGTKKDILAALQRQEVNAHLMSDALITFLQGRPIPLPGNHTPKRPDHKQQLLPGHLPTQKEDQPLEQPLANGCIIIVLHSQGAPCYAVYHSLATLSGWTGLPTSRVYSNHDACHFNWLRGDTCRCA